MYDPRDLIAEVAADNGWRRESDRRTDSYTRAGRRVIVEWSPWRQATSIDIDGQTLSHQAADMVDVDGACYPFFDVQHIPAVLRAA